MAKRRSKKKTTKRTTRRRVAKKRSARKSTARRKVTTRKKAAPKMHRLGKLQSIVYEDTNGVVRRHTVKRGEPKPTVSFTQDLRRLVITGVRIMGFVK